MIERIAVLGAGSVGQALAGHLQTRGFRVSLWNRSPEKIEALTRRKGFIRLRGVIEEEVQLSLVTTSMADAIKGAELIFITTSADGHRDIARQLAPLLRPLVRAIVLMPGRTFGGVVFSQTLAEAGSPFCPPVYETQTVVHTCRRDETGCRVFGIKKGVLYSSFYDPHFTAAPAIEFVMPELALERDPRVIPFFNIGCMLHPTVMLLNYSRVDAGEPFRFYLDGITPGVARFLGKVDRERVQLALAAGVRVPSLVDWLQEVYGLQGNDLYELIHSNPAYADIAAPTTPHHRYILEDVPTGLVPLAGVGDVLGVDTPCMDGMIMTLGQLMERDFTVGFPLSEASLRRLLRQQLVAG